MSENVNETPLSVDELVVLTKKFIRLADELYKTHKISKDEYDELTHVKKNFLRQVEKERQIVINNIV